MEETDPLGEWLTHQMIGYPATHLLQRCLTETDWRDLWACVEAFKMNAWQIKKVLIFFSPKGQLSSFPFLLSLTLHQPA
jgi:hypothetical protein